uniref:Low-density lipoprotein receptor domain class A n=1 Tax=Globodera pallida TaxID=36090 RepID=A0A183C7D5_GLOPA
MNTPKFVLLLLGFSLYYKLGDIVHAASGNGQQQHGTEGQCDKNSEMDFDCGDGELRTRCITSFWHCDQVFDCSTGKDELDCMYLHKCPTGHIACRNGDCFSATSRCDGHNDCDDGWDERGCNEAKRSTAESSLNIVQKIHNRPADEEEHENGLDITDVEGQAEAMVDESDRETNSAASFLLFSTLLFIAVSLVGFVIFRRYPSTVSRLNQTFKEFNQSISSSARTLLNNGRASSVQSHVTIATSANNNNNDHQFFDNPLHLQNPLVLSVHSTAPRSTIGQPPIV